MDQVRVVAEQLRVRCVAPGRMQETSAEFRYAADDPYAVAVTVHTGGDCYVRWDLARTLLVQGITEPAGLGDISVWPHVHEDGRDVVVLSMCSRHGEVVGEVDTTDLHRFLSRTLVLVPLGSESAQIDVDRVVEQLLSY